LRKEPQLGEKSLYLSLELVSQCEKSGEITLRVNLWILGINIKPLLRTLSQLYKPR
jgi:hypothetical protein